MKKIYRGYKLIFIKLKQINSNDAKVSFLKKV